MIPETNEANPPAGEDSMMEENAEDPAATEDETTTAE